MAWLPNTKQYDLPILDHGHRDTTRLIVIHCIEGGARGARDYFQGGTGGNPGVGAHLIMGKTPEESWQLVNLDNVCWHAVGANHQGPGIEHDGYSADSTWTWMRKRDMLNRSAARVAWICHQYGLGRPKRRVNVFSHSDGGAAWGGHGDPGPGWPWTYYMLRANWFYLRHWGRR